MSRNVKSKVKTAKSEIDFIYCDNRKCPYKECLRRMANAPFETLLNVRRYEIDKKGNCEGLELRKVLTGEMEKQNLWDM